MDEFFQSLRSDSGFSKVFGDQGSQNQAPQTPQPQVQQSGAYQSQYSPSPAIQSAARQSPRMTAFASGGRVGALTGATGGRADKLPMNVPDGSHVIPADVVSALGQGNSQHGHKVLSRMFPRSSPRATTNPGKPRSGLRKNGGEVPIMASDGEFIVSPEDVARRGGGNHEHGHRVLDHFILHTRKENIDNLKNLPGPARD